MIKGLSISIGKADLGMAGVILYTVLSGALRKWVFGPGMLSEVIFLTQLLIPFGFLFWSKKQFQSDTGWPGIFIVFLVYLAFAAINPKNLTIYHGILGIIVYLNFFLYMLTYERYREFFDLEKLTGLLIIIVVGEFFLSSTQYALPGTHFLNQYATGEANDAGVRGLTRVSGTFSYLGGFQALVVFYGFFVWFLLVRKVKWFITLPVAMLTLVQALMTVSRGAVLVYLALVIMGMVLSGKELLMRFLPVGGVLMVVVMVLGSIENPIQTEIDTFLFRFERGVDSGEFQDRIEHAAYGSVFNFRGEYPIYGIGLGATYQGALILFGRSQYAKEHGYVESERERVILEGGFILLILWLLMILMFLNRSYIPVLGRIVILGLVWNSMIVFNVYNGVFYALGICFVDRAYFLKYKENQSV